MKMMNCPLNGPRPLSEFVYGGPVRALPDPGTTSDEAWAHAIFDRESIPGVTPEWWCHTPSHTWFIAERDTETDTVQRTFLYPGAPS